MPTQQAQRDAVVEPGEVDGAEAAAGEARAADAVGVDVGRGREVVERPLVLGREDAGPGRPRAEEALGHDVLVLDGELVVRLDLGLGLRVRPPSGPCGSTSGRSADADATAGEGEGVVDQHGVAALGQLVGPAHAAVIVAPGAAFIIGWSSSLIWAILRVPKYLLPPWSCSAEDGRAAAPSPRPA